MRPLKPEPPVPVTVYLPPALWRAVQLCAETEGSVTAVVLQALEAYFQGTRASEKTPGSYRDLIGVLRRPIAALQLSGRAERALTTQGIRYLYELVGKSKQDIYPLKNFGARSLQQLEDRLAALGLRLGMPLEEPVYRAAALAAILLELQASAPEPDGGHHGQAP